MTTIATSKDALAQAKTRMEKAVEDFRKELVGRADRPRERVLARPHARGLSRDADADQSAWHAERSRPGDDRDCPVGCRARLPLIDKAIRTSDLGLNPANDGKVVRVPIPPLTEERRKDLVKHIHKVLENHRTAVRNIRRDMKEAVEKLEKEKKISEDEKKRSLDELEKLTHSETKKIEDLSATKEKEVMEIK